MKILIAEDDKFLASAYKVKLTKAGFEAKIASNGEETMKMLEEFIPDLILLDLIMPIKDGFTTLQELKASEKFKNIPVIVASNLGQKEDIEKAKALGAEDYVIKSNLELNDLVVKVESYKK